MEEDKVGVGKGLIRKGFIGFVIVGIYYLFYRVV